MFKCSPNIFSILIAAAAISFISPVFADAQMTYTKDVAPLIQNNCAECHRPGEAAPMSLLSYEEVRPWIKKIREVVEKRVMPPWHANPSVGNWKNDRRLSKAEMNTILGWIDSGAPKGNPEQMPRPLNFVEGWRIGEPDQIFEMRRPEVLPADLEDEYRYKLIPTGFKQDRWIKAAEVRPGNNEVVHHVIIFAANAGSLNQLTAGIGGYAPGSPPTILPEGYAIKLPAGSLLVLQIHYHKEKGYEATDLTRIGVQFADKPVHKSWNYDFVGTDKFNIPAGASRCIVRANKTIRENVHIRTIVPHMHLRGVAMKVWAKLPDGTKIDIIDIPAYDFNWQTFYEMQEPIALPKGTMLVAKATYDNSSNNPWNPNPDRDVGFGLPTTAEMMFAFFVYTKDAEKLNEIDPEARRKVAQR